ncbi:Pleckstrin like domain containing family A member 3 [Dissostichus eleginoides]|uniref:Pleckstrin like domain containing family A member 3 n=1 Tax=Dissostichus eleginoides TaxID=100907 RepID=A0AAD9CRA5_DISEL|nr:Pleckstrin like domain containing family A member 3 [Dissostichus eleginoides]
MEGPRWFVLQNGFISYYDSEDDVGKGSKGSIKMSVCEIKVHLSDATRLDLLVPGEQHFYVRAVNAAERQCWLLALGSSKAGTLDKHKGVPAQCDLYDLHQDSGGLHDSGQPESDP